MWKAPKAIFFILLLLFFSVGKAGDDGCFRSAKSNTTKLSAKNIKTSLSSKALQALPEPSSDFHNFSNVKAVDVTDKIPVGKKMSNQAYYLLVKRDQIWRSYFAKNFFDVESDPTWVISVLGPKLAKFFGFGLIDENTMIVPNAERYNYKIKQMNKLLVSAGLEEISFTFTDSVRLTEADREMGIGSAEAFIRDFTYHRKFPIVWSELIHDVSHHSLNVLMTSAQLKPLLQRYEVALRFADFIRRETTKNEKGYKILSEKVLRDTYLNLFFQILSRDIDNLSGLIPVEILNQEAQSNHSFFRIVDHHMGSAFAELGRTNAAIKSYHLYSVSKWLQKMNQRMFTALKEVAFVGDSSISYFLDRKEQARERRNLIINHEQLGYETRMLFTMFKEQLKDLDLEGMVEYDFDLNVVNGIAARESPLDSYLRRVEELNALIKEQQK